MSGINKQQDANLGYDDSHVQTAQSRNLYALMFYSMNWRPGAIFTLTNSTHVITRRPHTINEQWLADETDVAIRNMMEIPQ